jgi:hypothetical protein
MRTPSRSFLIRLFLDAAKGFFDAGIARPSAFPARIRNPYRSCLLAVPDF